MQFTDFGKMKSCLFCSVLIVVVSGNGQHIFFINRPRISVKVTTTDHCTQEWIGAYGLPICWKLELSGDLFSVRRFQDSKHFKNIIIPVKSACLHWLESGFFLVFSCFLYLLVFVFTDSQMNYTMEGEEKQEYFQKPPASLHSIFKFLHKYSF